MIKVIFTGSVNTGSDFNRKYSERDNI